MTRARNISKILSAQETTGSVNLSGVVTATNFFGEASGLTGITAVGTGVTILRDGSSIGAATKINFDNTFTVTDVSSGISTITGASSGVTTADVSTSSLVVAGISTLQNVTAGVVTANQFSGDISGVAATFTSGITGIATGATESDTSFGLSGTPNINVGLATATDLTSTDANISGIATIGLATVTSVYATNAEFAGVSTFQNNLRLGDGDGGYPRIIMGDSSDFYIYHSSVYGNVLQDVNANGVQIWANSLTVKNSSVTHTGLLVQPGSSTELYYNNFKKFETASNGISVTGIVTATGHVSSGIVTYYGDSSYSAAGRWTLAASGTDHYVFTGPGLGHSSLNDPTLYLMRGQTYMFENKMGAHPFRIQSTVNGSTGTQWNVGVTNNDVSNGVLIFEVPFECPSTLYYQCTSHANMGGILYIVT